jgi:hypothetical protein
MNLAGSHYQFTHPAIVAARVVSSMNRYLQPNISCCKPSQCQRRLLHPKQALLQSFLLSLYYLVTTMKVSLSLTGLFAVPHLFTL